MSGAAGALRRLAQEAPRLSRGIHVGKPALGSHDAPHYIHAETMYEAWNIKHKKLKWGTAITLFVATGFGVPFVAVLWQQKKAAG